MRHRPLMPLLLVIACATEDIAEDGVSPGATPTDTAAPVEAAPLVSDDPRFAPLIEAVQADLDASLATAAQVAVWMDGEVHYVGGFGSARHGEDVPVTGSTLFMIGSDTKKLAAIRLLQRVDAGEITLGTTVGEVLPDLNMFYNPALLDATVHDLLSHQGGMRDGAPFSTETDDGQLADYTYGEFARRSVGMAPPGEFWNYSNPNFSLAGHLDEALDAQGRPWADLVTDEVLRPLGMNRTFARKADLDGETTDGFGITSPSATRLTEVPFEETWEHAWVRPAGLVWSTASDQARLAGFLLEGNGDVLDPALHAMITEPQVAVYPDLPRDLAYGYGVILASAYSSHLGDHATESWTHGGNTYSHTSTFAALPEHGLAISILSNGYHDAFSRSVDIAFTTLADLPEPTPEPDVVVDVDALEGLAGTFLDPWNVGTVVVSRVDDHLEVDMPDLDAEGVPYEAELTPLSTRVWLLGVRGTTLDVAFVDGNDGALYLRNRSFVAVRPPDGGVARRARTPVDAGPWAARLTALPPLPHGLRLRR